MMSKPEPKLPSNSTLPMAKLLKLFSIKSELGEKIDAAKKQTSNNAKGSNNGAVPKDPSGLRVSPKNRIMPTKNVPNRHDNQNLSNLTSTIAKSGNRDKSNKASELKKKNDMGGLDFEHELDNMFKSAEIIHKKPIDNALTNKNKIARLNEEKLLEESDTSDDMDMTIEEEILNESEPNKNSNDKEEIVNDSVDIGNQDTDDDDIILIEFESTPAQKDRDSQIENQAMMNNNQLIALQVELLKKDEEIDSNADQIDVLTVKNQDLNEEFDKIKQKNEELNEDIMDLQKKFDRTKTVKDDLFKSNKKADATISDLKNALSSKDEELKKKKRELSEKSSLNSEFYKRLLDLTKLNTEFNTKTKQSQENLKKKVEELKGKDVSEKMLQKEIKKLLPQITELEKNILEKKEENNDLDEKLKSFENILKAKNDLLHAKEEADKILQTEIEEIKKDQEENNKVNSELYKQLLHLTKQNTDSSSRIKELEDDLQTSEGILKANEESEKCLKKELNDLKTQSVELKSIADEKISMYNLAESKLIATETSLKGKESELEEKLSELNSLGADNLNLKATAEEKTASHDSAVSKLNTFDKILKEKESALLKKESEVNILQGENLELKVRVSHLNVNIDDQAEANKEKVRKLETVLEEKKKYLNTTKKIEIELLEKLEEQEKQIRVLKINAEVKNKDNFKLSTDTTELKAILCDQEEIINAKAVAESILGEGIDILNTYLEELKDGTNLKETMIEEFTSKVKNLEYRLKQNSSNKFINQRQFKRKSVEQLQNPQKRRNFEQCDTVITDIIHVSIPGIEVVIQELVNNIVESVISIN